MPLMFRLSFFVLLIGTALFAKDCDFSLGDLDQFVINYKVSVSNFGNEPAAVTVSIQDKQRSATLDPGDKIEVTSFKGGVWHISVVGSKTRKATLQDRYTRIRANLDAALQGHADTDLLNQYGADLRELRKALETVGDGPDAGTCAGRMNDPGGDTLGIAVTNTSVRSAAVTWHCVGR
jgi:hypothetical protein